jgi:peptidoglycan hydrolase-like protein with peptidoglycan-binding domain
MSTKRNIKKAVISIAIATTVAIGATSASSGVANAAVASKTVSASSFVNLQIGARSAAVREMQIALLSKGIQVPGGADGIFGPATQNALKTFQTKNGLRATGSLNRRTARKLGLLGSSPAQASAVAPDRIDETKPVRIGQTGEQVKLVQNALILAGIKVSGGADGAFGPATQTAVKSFQASKGLNQTGVVDSATAKALNSYFELASTVDMKVFPVQGNCGFSDTWHAPRSGGRQHEGVDIIANSGNYLYAVNTGTITKITVDHWLSGNALRLTLDNGTYFYYGHLREFAPGIAVGTRVSAGQIIGTVGDTGETTVNHLHFEIHPGGGDAVNPYPYVKAIDNCKSSIVPLQPGLK